ncbi:MAG: peroxidase family protein [Phycisphaeraceae bacterium]
MRYRTARRCAAGWVSVALGLALLIAPPASAETRTIDGSGNNRDNPDWGRADMPLRRVAPSAYPGDGSGETIRTWPNPRSISNAIVDQGGAATPNVRGMSNLIWQWGQFLDHDISLTPHDAANGAAPIPVPDPNDPLAPGPIPLTRSDYVADQGRQQVNVLTNWIDASQVYGSDGAHAASLRAFERGRLRTGANNLLPPAPDGSGMLAGDERVNEQIGLTAMHTVFMREHNRLADAIATRAPQLDDEAVYQAARRVVGAEMQHITYDEFLPALMGDDAPHAADYQYDPTIDPRINNSFSTALFRFGHSLVPDQLALTDARGRTVETLQLHEAFFAAEMLRQDPERVDDMLRGLAAHPASELDAKVVDGMRNFLFGGPGRGGMDLAAINIQRGRDHGLPDYNTLREAYGLSPVGSFRDITSDAAIRDALAATYGDVDQIDPWIGALAEDHRPGSSLGELLTAALRDQFTRLRDGDRFFFADDALLREVPIAEVIDVESVRLADVIERNTSIEGLPENVFFVRGAGAQVIPAPSAVAGGLALLGVLVLRRRGGW